VTLNANPESLGKPDPSEVSVQVGEEATRDRGLKPTTQEWRRERLKERLGTLFPNDLSADGMTQKNYGRSILRVVKLAVDREALNFRDRRIVWALATHYKDGQAMVTAALVVCRVDDTEIEELVKGWEFYATTEDPHRLDLPALSSLERLTMESSDNPQDRMKFQLPMSEMEEDPLSNFKKYYRIYPHFSRVEL
jgi:hypothetical protein